MDGQNFNNNQFNNNFNAEQPAQQQPVQQQPVQQPTQQNFYQDNTAANTNPYAYAQQQVPPVYSPVQPEPQQSNALSIVSLVMGIISIIFGCCYGVGIIFAIAGLICAIVAKKKGQKGGLSTAGLICSIIGAVIAVIVIVYVVIIGVALVNDPDFMNSFSNSYYY